MAPDLPPCWWHVLQRQQRPGLSSWLSARVDIWRVELLMATIRVLAWWSRIVGRSSGSSSSGAGGSREELPPEFTQLLQEQGVDVAAAKQEYEGLRQRAVAAARAA
jgi:hypothetical protein